MSPWPRLVLVMLLGAWCSLLSPHLATAAPRTLVTSLPGFNSQLPFHLETGYVTVDEENDAELFYYFVESEGDPGRDPVLLWLTGGDRCSVLSGLAFEIGPFQFVEEPYSWSKIASVLFVDWPVGAGFSFSRNPRLYENGLGDVPSSLQLKNFLTKWFIEHPDYLSNPFYIGADSYAGKISPFLALKISEDIEAGLRPRLNLKGYVVGNPVTGTNFDNNSRVPFAHGHGIISDQLYERITRLCQGEDYTYPKKPLCIEALDIFNYVIDHEISKPHILYPRCDFVSVNLHNGTASRHVLKEENGRLHNPPSRPPIYCAQYKSYLSYFWANNNATRDALGIKKGTVKEWRRCQTPGLPSTNHGIKSSIMYHHCVSVKGYRSLVYSGGHDIVVPFLGTQAWVRSLNYSIVDDWRAWKIDGQSGGFTISYLNNMTFATIKGGGHTAPEYQPKRCFAMMQRWISGKPL
ncbi:unnamed protein product [Urochloa humidicola]